MATNVASVSAFTLVGAETSIISSHSMSGDTVEYCLKEAATVKVAIYKADNAASSTKLETLVNNVEKSAGCHEATWDDYEYNSKYFYGIYADDDYQSDWLSSKGSSTSGKFKIADFEVEDKIFDPYDDQEVKFNFVLDEGAYITLEITDEDDDEVLNPVEEKWYSEGDHTIKWDGKDKFDDETSNGEYNFDFIAENKSGVKDKESGYVIVKKGAEASDSTDEPRLKEVSVTKETFDPGSKEDTAVIFTLSAKGDVKIEVYTKDDEKLGTIYDKDDQSAGDYKIVWDGEEADGESGVYKLKISTENDKGDDTETVYVSIEDEDDSDEPNIYRDEMDGTKVKFYLEKSATVTVEIKDSSRTIATLVDEENLSSGSYSFEWDGSDKYGEDALNGLYEYKITAKSKKGKDTEEGYFNLTEGMSNENSYGQNEKCANFKDVAADHDYCEAIEWAKANEIFAGYNDGSFKPNGAITRAEALKTIFNALNIDLIKSSQKTGFKDVGNSEWYVSYIKTGLSLGIVKGYNDQTFRPNSPVTRVEGLTMLLNTGSATDDLIIPTNNYGQPYFDTPNTPSTRWYLSYVWMAKTYELNDNENYFYPDSSLTRAEMADMLYRYSKNF